MLESILIVSIVSLVLLVWFDSEAFVEYVMLLRLGGLFGTKKYLALAQERPSLTYLEYIRGDGPEVNFLVKMISCPLCLSFWLTMLVTYLVSGTLFLFPAYNILSLIVYKLTSKTLRL